ncbi:hypothetical protein SteCoe_19256 [Stentor coeruleus]|uniref:RING-type domain-containing protein n=1 Tax=Stentor coeruleus TaxID=5963 RepID=A0A1R2BUM5_9CILI|nr:hypothetical protein SteCoe_19256 [Stentor coeruleus]
MINYVIFFLLASCYSTFVFHTPDYLSGSSLTIIPLKLGIPAFYKIYGNLFLVDSYNCETNYYGLNETFLVFLYPTDCNITDIAVKSYQAGTPLIMLADDYKLTLSKKIGAAPIPDNFPSITIIAFTDDIYNLVCNMPVVSGSYIYDITKYNGFYIDIILGGYHDEDKDLIDNFSNLYANYSIDPINVSFNFNYNKNVNESSDCINYHDTNYCTQGINEYTGHEVLSNLLLIASYYSTLPKNYEGFLVFLNYLSVYYNKCYTNYTFSCNTEVLLSSYTSNIDFLNYDLLTSAYSEVYNREYFNINYYYFPWDKYLEQGYCLAFNTPDSKCPLCSLDCSNSMLEDNYCHPQCNNTSCGYQNLQCLQVYPGCYSFMLKDGICNGACYESSKNSNCVDFVEADTQLPKSQSFSIRVYVPLIIVFGSIIILFFIIFICAIVRKRRTQASRRLDSGNLKKPLDVQKFDRDMKILGEAICPIDLEEFKDNDDVVITPCKHIFHPECLKEWIEKAENIQKGCPICKNPLNDLEISNRI